MAFTRKRFKRKRTYRTKKARKARKVARVGTVKRMLNKMVEHKWNYITSSGTVNYDTSVPLLLNGFVRGTQRNQRLANQIRLVSAQWTLLCVSGNQQASRIRILLFRDKQPAIGISAGNQVANMFARGSPASTQMVLSALSPDQFPARFVKIFDKVYHTDVEGGATDINAERQYRGFKRLNFVTQYNDGNAGNLSDIIKNAFYVLIISDEASGGTQPTVTFDMTFKFVDA